MDQLTTKFVIGNQVRNYVGNKAKWRILKRVFQEKKDVKFSEKPAFLTPWYAHVYAHIGVRIRG